MSVYSYDKGLAHLDRLAALQRGEQPPPVHMQVVLSDLCNQLCNFCAYRMPDYSSAQLFGVEEEDGTVNRNPNRKMSTRRALALLEEARALGVRAVQFTGGGEPTVHPDIVPIMEHAHTLGLETSLVTNGVKMSRALRELLVASSTWIRMSLDAGLADTYATMRRAPREHFDAAIENLTHLAKLRDAKNSKLYIGVGFVVNRDNWREVLDAARIAYAAGADNFRISGLFQTGGDDYFEGFREEAAALCRRAEEMAETSIDFTVSNRFLERVADLEQGSPDYSFCTYQNLTTYVGADLSLYRCCIYAYNDRGRIGSLRDRSLVDLWNSSEKRADFAGFDARGCERCQFNPQNRRLDRVVHARFDHVNFV